MRATEAHFHWRWSHDVLECFLIGAGVDVIGHGDTFSRVRTLGKPVEAAPMGHENGTAEPTFTLTPEAAQQLMDQLWQVGLRPTEGTGSAGSLAATQKHLNDMRAIVSKQIGVQFNAIQH